MIQNLYPNDFHIDIDYEPNIQDVNFLKQYQIVHIHRNIGSSYEGNDQLIKWIISLGITTVVDIDDFWLPGKEHPIHHIIVENKINQRIVANLAAADYVTTTTTIFADEIKKHIPEFKISYEPDFRQQIADSWPKSIDDSSSRNEWGWKPSYDLDLMVKDMLDVLGKKHQEGKL
jgi:hypothetical protein